MSDEKLERELRAITQRGAFILFGCIGLFSSFPVILILTFSVLENNTPEIDLVLVSLVTPLFSFAASALFGYAAYRNIIKDMPENDLQ